MSICSFDDVKKYILTQASGEELDILIDFYKVRRKTLGVEIGLSFKPGDPVWFDARSRGIVKGTFVRQMNKNAEVKATNGVVWKVAPQLLNKDKP